MDSFGTLILAWVETKKAKCNEVINDSNIKLQNSMNPKEKLKNPIGFAPTRIEKEDEENDF